MFYKGNEDREKRLRFSIRKVSFGAASVAVAALYLFMGSGAVSAEEAQAVQSNEEVAADKDSETEKKSENQQPTYAAPAAKEQGSATNTEAGDEGKQESHPETKEEEANSSERSETTTKTQSDENSVSGDSSSPKSEGEGTRSEEASNKPKVRKRRDAPAPPATATDDDPDANQTYEAPGDGAGLDELKEKLEKLPSAIQNNTKINDMDKLGEQTNTQSGQVKNITNFGGWKAVGETGKFAIAKKTEDGVFPIETVNTVYSEQNGKHYRTYTGEQAFDRTSNYILLLSEVRTRASSKEAAYDNSEYRGTGLSGSTAKALKDYNGIEKTFKAYSTEVGSKVKIQFKTGYTGDINGTKAKYKVEVIVNKNGKPETVYSKMFDPQKDLTDSDATVTKARDGNGQFIRSRFNNYNLNKTEVESKMKGAYIPTGTAGTFESKEIDLEKGVTDYTVRISSADNEHLGMGYQSPLRQYALPISGLGFNITQDTNKIAKDLLSRIYEKLKATAAEDERGMTSDSKDAYNAELEKVKNLIENINLDTTDNYKKALKNVLQKQKELTADKTELTEVKTALEALTGEADPTTGKTTDSAKAYNDAKTAAQEAIQEAETVINDENATPEAVTAALEKVNAKKAALQQAKDGLIEAATAEEKAKLKADAAQLTKADETGKTPDSIAAYEAEYEKLKTQLEEAKAAAAAVEAKGDNATKAEATEAQSKVEAAKTALDKAAELLKALDRDGAKKEIEAAAKKAIDAIEASTTLTPEQKAEEKAKVAKEVKDATDAIDKATTEDGINSAKDKGKLVIEKEVAITAINAEKTAKEKEIDNNSNLSDDEKAAAKKQAQAAADKA
ncbi:YSIRK-type signal peptide-containing protein, partial [Streptococcus sp. 477]|uniref:YSIRK-type signal peptide-containing protein n=1 Tax=Streptococcus sp. 477 TaxID=2582644 RepID=UPI0015626184